LQKKFDGLEDMGLIVGDQDTDLVFLIRDGSPPVAVAFA
jgi:hypothetical protein